MRARDKQYIMQGRDTSCQLIALLNAFIYKFGVTPIEYKTKEFRMLAEIGFGVSGPLLSMKENIFAQRLSLRLTTIIHLTCPEYCQNGLQFVRLLIFRSSDFA